MATPAGQLYGQAAWGGGGSLCRTSFILLMEALPTRSGRQRLPRGQQQTVSHRQTCFCDSFQHHRHPGRRRGPLPSALWAFPMLGPQSGAVCVLCASCSSCNVSPSYLPGKHFLVLTPLHPYAGEHGELWEPMGSPLCLQVSQGQAPLLFHADL